MQAGDEHATDARFAHVQAPQDKIDAPWRVRQSSPADARAASADATRAPSSSAAARSSTASSAELAQVPTISCSWSANARPRRLPARLRLVRDRVAGCGPLGGLDAALAAARHDALVLVACDMPFVTARLLGIFWRSPPRPTPIVPRTERGYHPLCAAYTRACQPAIADRLDRRQLRMMDFLADVRVRVVTGDELAALGRSPSAARQREHAGRVRWTRPATGHEL